jgi:hypothetical protein
MVDRDVTVSYMWTRKMYPLVPAKRVLQWLNNDYAVTLPQFICKHDWAVNGETDACYCLNCGLDGDA